MRVRSTRNAGGAAWPTKHILYDVQDHILTITLNRPDKLNAFTGMMQAELIDAFDRADKDDDVRAIIVTGAGRGFCAGADLPPAARRSTAPRAAARAPTQGGRLGRLSATTACATAAAASRCASSSA